MQVARNPKTFDQLLQELDEKKPGAADLILHNLNRRSRDVRAGTWSRGTCYAIHHYCEKNLSRPVLKIHVTSRSCGACMDTRYNTCMKDGTRDSNNSCSRCARMGLVCLTVDDVMEINNKLMENCEFRTETFNYWEDLRFFLDSNIEEKTVYLRGLIEQYISAKTVYRDHPNAEKPCRVTNTRDKLANANPRTQIVIWCMCNVEHTRRLTGLSLLRLAHLLDAYESGDEEAKSYLLSSTGDISHACGESNGIEYCWEVTHVNYEDRNKNFMRDNYCFPGKLICKCDKPCLRNGYGARFVPNKDPVDPRYGHWRPASGTNGRERYPDCEQKPAAPANQAMIAQAKKYFRAGVVLAQKAFANATEGLDDVLDPEGLKAATSHPKKSFNPYPDGFRLDYDMTELNDDTLPNLRNGLLQCTKASASLPQINATDASLSSARKIKIEEDREVIVIEDESDAVPPPPPLPKARRRPVIEDHSDDLLAPSPKAPRKSNVSYCDSTGTSSQYTVRSDRRDAPKQMHIATNPTTARIFTVNNTNITSDFELARQDKHAGIPHPAREVKTEFEMVPGLHGPILRIPTDSEVPQIFGPQKLPGAKPSVFDSSDLPCTQEELRSAGPDEEGLYHCPVRNADTGVACGSTTLSSRNLWVHLRLVHAQADRRDFVCDLCGAAFKQNCDLNGHKKRMHELPTYRCKVLGCNKVYPTQADLAIHERRNHSEQRPFICDHCTKTFKTRHDLKKHRATHTDRLDHPCDMCSKSFSNAGNLKRHKVQAHGHDERPKLDAASRTPADNLNRYRQARSHEKRPNLHAASKTLTVQGADDTPDNSQNSASTSTNQVRPTKRPGKWMDGTADVERITCDYRLSATGQPCGRTFASEESYGTHMRQAHCMYKNKKRKQSATKKRQPAANKRKQSATSEKEDIESDNSDVADVGKVICEYRLSTTGQRCGRTYGSRKSHLHHMRKVHGEYVRMCTGYTKKSERHLDKKRERPAKSASDNTDSDNSDDSMANFVVADSEDSNGLV